MSSKLGSCNAEWAVLTNKDGTRRLSIVVEDGRTFREWAQLNHGQSDTLDQDAMSATTARVHRLTVVTRNVADFEAFGVPLLNPFEVPRQR